MKNNAPIRSVFIDMEFATMYDLKLTEAALYSYILYAAAYAKQVIYDGKAFIFLSRNMVAERMSHLTGKPDTIYRYYRGLQAAGVVEYAKIDGKDCLFIVPEIAKKWNADKRPNSSDKRPSNGEKLGQTSKNTRINVREHSDKRPTYNRSKSIIEVNDRERRASAELPPSPSTEITESKSSQSDVANSGGAAGDDLPGHPLPGNPEFEAAENLDRASDPDNPRAAYIENNFADFTSDDPGVTTDNILARLRRYHEDNPGTGKRICEQAKKQLSPKEYWNLLKTWVDWNATSREFYRNPVRHLTKGKSNLRGWIRKEYREVESEQVHGIDVKGYDSPIMRMKREAQMQRQVKAQKQQDKKQQAS